MTIGFYRWGLYLERHGHWRLTLRFRPHTNTPRVHLEHVR